MFTYPTLWRPDEETSKSWDILANFAKNEYNVKATPKQYFLKIVLVALSQVLKMVTFASAIDSCHLKV